METVVSAKGLTVLRKYEEDYWQTVAKASEFLPEGALPDFITGVKQVFIYDCTDGYLILRYGEQKGNEFVLTLPSFIGWQTLLHQQKLYDQYGKESTRRLTLQMKEPAKFLGHFVSIAVESITREGLVLRPKYLSATIVVGEPGENLSDGHKTAKNDIRILLAASSLGVQVVPKIEVTRERVIRKLQSLLADYKQCLTEAEREEDVQQFLRENPFVLNPWGTIYPKYRLGKEYVCDFLIEDRLAPDFMYIFVEIEPVVTPLFLKSKNRQTEFTAVLHRALNQLRDWEIWTRDNIAYLRQNFPEFDQAGCILVIGRSTNLSSDQRKVVVNENQKAKNLTILTYDDLANRLEGMIDSLRELIANEQN